jgi:L-rhamnose mutarotase
VSTNRHCLFLDLKNDENLIREYEAHHEKVWPEIIESIRNAGITSMEIYRAGNRLALIMDTDENFSFEKKSQMDEQNEKVQEWENLMWQYQQALPIARSGEKWMLSKKIFQL